LKQHRLVRHIEPFVFSRYVGAAHIGRFCVAVKCRVRLPSSQLRDWLSSDSRSSCGQTAGSHPVYLISRCSCPQIKVSCPRGPSCRTTNCGIDSDSRQRN
jgi:hypothetical protein